MYEIITQEEADRIKPILSKLFLKGDNIVYGR